MDHLTFRSEASGWRRCGWGEEGLTLAELVTTLGLSAIVLLAMAPVMSRLLDVYQLRGAAQQIYGELQRARLVDQRVVQRVTVMILSVIGLVAGIEPACLEGMQRRAAVRLAVGIP